jgi:hypothetical protein
MNSKLLSISFTLVFLSFAVVIKPKELFIEPRRMNVAPYLFSRSKETPPILQSWKKEFTCLSDRPKCKRKGMKQKLLGSKVTTSYSSSLFSPSKVSTIFAI